MRDRAGRLHPRRVEDRCAQRALAGCDGGTARAVRGDSPPASRPGRRQLSRLRLVQRVGSRVEGCAHEPRATPGGAVSRTTRAGLLGAFCALLLASASAGAIQTVEYRAGITQGAAGGVAAIAAGPDGNVWFTEGS